MIHLPLERKEENKKTITFFLLVGLFVYFFGFAFLYSVILLSLFKISKNKSILTIYTYMKSSFPKRDKRQIKKKWVRHAILLCTELIHCSINVSCQIAIFPCLKCTARCSSFPNESTEPVFSLNAICPLDQSEFVRYNPTRRRFEAFVCAQSSKWVL